VRSTTDTPLVDCIARLLSAERSLDGGVESVLDEPMYCQWSNTYEEQRVRITIPPGVTYPSNMFSISAGQTFLKPETQPYMKPRMLREIQKPGKYRLNVAVSATDAPIKFISFILKWDNSYEGIALTIE
jgi:hypothetical protein